ncbi:hypothetical protein M422DRAFT_165297 [Sphaerobolus stellatus SS14]|nr:hypothetical protein M422DRAFT_165297 [Sphaerobolus stellatus SS14]
MTITVPSPIHENYPKKATAVSLYSPTPDDLAMLKRLTGINDETKLKEHVLRVQTEAYEVYPYPCIAWFQFISYRISNYPFYNSILTIGKERPGAIYADLGCCFGNDGRRVIADGYPIENVVLSDLQGGFAELAHKLYQTTPDTYPVPFLAGDIFDPTFLSPQNLTSKKSSRNLKPPVLKDLKTLSPLKGHVSIIHAAWLFHLFGEQKQRQLASLLASLLSPLPGSMIVGSHLDLPDTEGNKKGGFRWSDKEMMVFAHSPTSWRALWEDIFGTGKVRVESWVGRWKSPWATSGGPERYLHTWKVTRL